MIDRIEIRNFQSLANIQLDLAPLTVIVGASSSGKSAFIRALHALHGNRRGTAFITHGERTASISAHIASRDSLRSGTVTLTRSTQTSPNSYTLIPDDPHHPLHPKAEFTKLGGTTPSEITDFLGVTADTLPLNIASQFDKPYLLDASPAEVARTFGALTNAHIILNAARESNRRKLASSQTLKTRTADLEAIRARIPEFQALQTQREALDRAESLLTTARTLHDRLTRLSALADTLTIAQSRIPALTEALASIPDPKNIDALIDRLTQARSRLAAYQRTIQDVQSAQRGAQGLSEALSSVTQEHDSAQKAYKGALNDIAEGFEILFRSSESAKSADMMKLDAIEIHSAALLASRYVARLEG